MRICFLILNSFDYDTRARLICRDIINAGWDLEIIATAGGSLVDYMGAPVHRIDQPIKPFRQRRFIEYNVRASSIAGKLKFDIIHAVDLDTLWAASRASRYSGARVLYESRELYTELLSLKGRFLTQCIWKLLEKNLIRKADQVVAINHSIADELAKRYNINKPDVVMNVADITEIEPIDLRKKYDLNRKFILIYQGILRPGQGIDRILKALSEMPEVGLVIVGDGPYRSEIERLASELGVSDSIRFTGMIPPTELAAYTSGADAGLLLMEAGAMNNYLALPQKLFQYIESGVPPIVTNLPELRKVVETDKLGLVIDAEGSSRDRAVLKMFLEKEIQKAKENCLRIREKYSWQREGKRLMDIYRRLAGD